MNSSLLIAPSIDIYTHTNTSCETDLNLHLSNTQFIEFTTANHVIIILCGLYPHKHEQKVKVFENLTSCSKSATKNKCQWNKKQVSKTTQSEYTL